MTTTPAERPGYRLATVDDLDTLVDLRMAFLAEVSHAMPAEEVMRAALTSYFAKALSAGDFVAYLAEFDGRVIATSGLVYHHGPPSPRNMQGCEAYIMNMYTLPDYRRRGIASALLAKLIAHARLSCCRVVLHALSEAQSLYMKAGFVPLEAGLAEMRLIL